MRLRDFDSFFGSRQHVRDIADQIIDVFDADGQTRSGGTTCAGLRRGYTATVALIAGWDW